MTESQIEAEAEILEIVLRDHIRTILDTKPNKKDVNMFEITKEGLGKGSNLISKLFGE